MKQKEKKRKTRLTEEKTKCDFNKTLTFLKFGSSFLENKI